MPVPLRRCAGAAIELAGTRTWFSGRAACLRYLAHVLGSPGDWQLVPTLANGQPAAAAHYRGSAFGLGVLTVTPDGISRITVFSGGPGLVARFASPPARTRRDKPTPPPGPLPAAAPGGAA